MRIHLEVEVRRVWCRRYGKVKQERLPWLADNPFYTKRFAWYVGRRCRETTVKEVARELKLDWKTVKSLDKEYMREQLRRTGTPSPKAIGIDEISIKKGHTYRCWSWKPRRYGPNQEPAEKWLPRKGVGSDTDGPPEASTEEAAGEISSPQGFPKLRRPKIASLDSPCPILQQSHKRFGPTVQRGSLYSLILQK
jgi:hypothetical protein